MSRTTLVQSIALCLNRISIYCILFLVLSSVLIYYQFETKVILLLLCFSLLFVCGFEIRSLWKLVVYESNQLFLTIESILAACGFCPLGALTTTRCYSITLFCFNSDHWTFLVPWMGSFVSLQDQHGKLCSKQYIQYSNQCTFLMSWVSEMSPQQIWRLLY